MSWRQEQAQDRFFRLAKDEGYRARSAYKLLEICERFRLIQAGERVLDLGAAPGSWSQVAYERVGPTGAVVAVDLQPIEPMPGVRSIEGDIRAAETQARLRRLLGGKADVVLSDIAPSLTGIAVTDQTRSMELANLTLETALRNLKVGGAFVVKVFRGEGYGELMERMRQHFKRVNSVIPTATRGESRESFVVGRGFTGSAKAIPRAPAAEKAAPEHQPGARVVNRPPPEGWA